MRFVVCADPDGDEAVDGATVRGLATELEGHGHVCHLALAPGTLPPPENDDWLHVTSGFALHDSGSSRVLQVVGACLGAVSVDLFLANDDEDVLAHWEVLDPLLQLVGLAGGILFARASDVAALCGDPDQDPVMVGQAWAEAYGLALCVVADDVRVSAVKADGRTTAASRGPEALDREALGQLVGGFLTSYGNNPAGLEAALHGA